MSKQEVTSCCSIMSLAHRENDGEHNPGNDPAQSKSQVPLPNGGGGGPVERYTPVSHQGGRKRVFFSKPHTVLHKLYLLKTNAAVLNTFKSSQIRRSGLQVCLRQRAENHFPPRLFCFLFILFYFSLSSAWVLLIGSYFLC